MKTLAQIAAELEGYDPQALRAETVNVFLSELVAPINESEETGIFQALARVLAADIISPISVPPHDNSAMDGYAFDGAQLSSTSALNLKVVGTALAGKVWQGQVQPGQCVKIMTGAVMPKGLDTVVPQELATVRAELVEASIDPSTPSTSSGRTENTLLRTEFISIPPNVMRAGDNRRKLGEDLRQGQSALGKGELLTSAALGLIASLGIEKIKVWRKLRVAYFSTGDEILSLGQAPREGAVYDSNRYTVIGLLQRLGCEVLDLGVVGDQPALLEAAFKQAASQADAVITSGGVSVGEADYTKAMMHQLGDVAFWKIAMRPGRPLAVGRIGKSVLFGLPGNPVAVMVTFLAFVRPALLKMMGSTAAPAPLLKAHSSEVIRKKPGRTEYQRGIVSNAPDGSLQVRTTGNQGSGVLSSMVQANGLIVLYHNQGNVALGDVVDVMMFEGVI